MSGSTDEFDAARKIAELLESFDSTKRQLIIKWALEKLGDTYAHKQNQASSIQSEASSEYDESKSTVKETTNVKSFFEQKKPKNKIQTVAVVAYYYRFEAKPDERKEFIGPRDVTNALRLANWHRDTNPLMTLNNAVNQGLLDRAAEKGFFKISTVGENLIALVLPDGNNPTNKKTSNKRKAHKKKSQNKTSNKKRE